MPHPPAADAAAGPEAVAIAIQPAAAAGQALNAQPAVDRRILQWSALTQGAASGTEGADIWSAFCNTRRGDPDVVELLARIPRPDGEVARRLVALAQWASALPLQARGPHHPEWPLTRKDFLALGQALEVLLPPLVRQQEPARVAATLQALAEAGISAERLQMACRWSWVRDTLAQLCSSTVGYTCSFMTFNTLLEHFWGNPAASSSVPVVAHTALSMVAQRWLRMAEWLPGWTRPIEPDSLGRPVPFIQTPRGFLLVTAQYWPFLASLAYGSYGVNAPQAQVEAFRDYGFAATAGVAAHRMLFFSRDYPWLNASTPRARSAMLQSIDELCGWQSTAQALGKYLLVRPVAGLGGLILGRDWHPQLVEPATAPAQAPAEAQAQAQAQGAEAADAADELPPRALASPCEQVTTSIKRIGLFGVPMLVFATVKNLARAAGLNSDMVGTVNFLTLIPGWGVAMATNEREVGSDPTIAAETKSRAARLQAIQARQYNAAHPAAAAAAPGGAQ